MLAEATVTHAPYAHKSFVGAKGGAEHYFSITAPPHLSLQGQIEAIRQRYEEARRSLKLAPDTAVFRRLFLSDAINQAAVVQESSLYREPEESPVAVSMVQQPPLNGSKIAMLAYHVGASPMKKQRLSPRHLLIEKNGMRHLWSTRMCAGAQSASMPVDTQTWEVFSDLIGALASQGGKLAEHCVRTWIYIKDVDTAYRGMVESRGRLFAQHGLTEATHYIASTGIEGACAHQFDQILMDAYSMLDMAPGQMTYLQDLDKLCPTKTYKVHFERGTKLSYADRAHNYISGTASIGKAGQVVHRGDVSHQFDRALTNIKALLASGRADIDDMMYLIVYLRDRSDYARIRDQFKERFPRLPAVFVAGAVCRPEWLVELEGVAIAGQRAPEFPSF